MAHTITKRLRGVFALFAALLTAFALVPSTAMAATINATGSITITGNDVAQADTVNVYRVAWYEANDTTNVAELKYAEGMQSLVEAWDTNEGSADSAKAIADAANASMLVTPRISGQGTNELTIEGLATGVYYIQLGDSEGEIAYQPIVASVKPGPGANNTWSAVNPAPIAVKSSSTDLAKTAVDVTMGTVATDGSSVATIQGSTITFKVEFSLGRHMDEFWLKDTMTNMTYVDGSVQVFKQGESTAMGATYAPAVTDDNGAKKFTFSDPASLINAAYGADAANGSFYITYKATVNTDAAVGDDIHNSVTSSVNDGNKSVKVYLPRLVINKYDVDNEETLLPGAEFQLFDNKDCTGNPIMLNGKTTFVTESNGSITVNATNGDTFDIDPEAIYYLKETKAPSGYDLAADPIEVTFNFDERGNCYVGTADVPNTKSDFSLPTTGGMGTIAFTAAGVVIMAGAAAYILRSRKQN